MILNNVFNLIEETSTFNQLTDIVGTVAKSAVRGLNPFAAVRSIADNIKLRNVESINGRRYNKIAIHRSEKSDELLQKINNHMIKRAHQISNGRTDRTLHIHTDTTPKQMKSTRLAGDIGHVIGTGITGTATYQGGKYLNDKYSKGKS